MTMGEPLGTDFLRTLPARGARCPCCLKFTKIYRKAFNDRMARDLIWLVRRGPKFADADGWIHLPSKGDRDVLTSNQMGFIARWGLVEAKVNDNTKKRKSGIWRVTDAGRAFVRRQIWIPSHAITYNDELICLDGDSIDILAALDTPFDYEKLMSEAA